jgi:hypothetical protein
MRAELPKRRITRPHCRHAGLDSIKAKGTNMTTIDVKYHFWIPIAGKLFGAKSMPVPADLIVVCVWTITGLIVTALVATFDAGADLAGILAAAE